MPDLVLGTLRPMAQGGQSHSAPRGCTFCLHPFHLSL